MRVWIVQIGEALSWLDPAIRPGRCNLLARTLASRGHSVVWWSSTFSHAAKRYRFSADTVLEAEPKIELRLLHGVPSYEKNVCARRLLNQRSVAGAFRRAIHEQPAPELIFACVPTPEMSECAARYAVSARIPIVVDIRDPWPDAYLNVVPRWARATSNHLLAAERSRIRRTAFAASALTAVSDSYLQWALAYAGRERSRWDGVFPLASTLPTRDESIPAEANAGTSAQFVFAGSFSESADLETAIDAASLLAQRGREDITFVFAGSGDKLEALRRRASALQSVKFLGWLSQGKIEELFAKCDAGLALYATGATQSLPNKVFDYMASGLPIISSLRGEFADLARRENIGLQYEPGNPRSLAEQVLMLTDRPDLRAAMRANCLTIARRDYEPSRVYNALADRLETVAIGVPARRRIRAYGLSSAVGRSEPVQDRPGGDRCRKRRIWVVQMGELLPGVDGPVRDYRYMLLTNELARRGHEVVRWSSTFNHINKEFRFLEPKTIEMASGAVLRLLHGTPGYKQNVSIARVVQHRAVARQFRIESHRSAAIPDLIFAGVPVPELAEAAIDFGAERGVPVMVDVQDLWPDIYLSVFPRYYRRLVRALLSHEFGRMRKILHRAAAITAVSETYFDWALAGAQRSVRLGDGIYPLGSDSDASRPSTRDELQQLRASLGIEPGNLVALFVGTFGTSYDLETLARAASILQERQAPIHILIAGDGEKMPVMRRLTRDTRNITLAGWVDKDTVAQFMQLASVGLCAYTSQAMQSIPYKPIEYLANGLPILSSLGGELKDAMDAEHCGLFYEPGDHVRLAELLLWYANHSEDRALMAKRSRAFFESRFDARRIYPALADEVESLARQA